MNHIYMSDDQHPALLTMLVLTHECPSCRVVFDLEHCTGGDFLFLVGCTQIVKADVMSRYKHTLVLHASDLPKQRGWSPWIHSLRAGEEEICVSLLEAAPKVDTGDVWQKAWVSIERTDLFQDIADKIAIWSAELMRMAINGECDGPTPQEGEPTYCERLTEDSNKLTLSDDQWNVLRTSDPIRFPAWVEIDGKKFGLDVYPIEELTDED